MGASPGRRQQAVTALGGAAQIGTTILMGTVMAVYVDRGGGTPFAVGMVVTAYFLGTLVFAPVWGAVADITGRRRAVLVGTTALATLSVLPLTVLDGVWLPVGVRALYAVFAAGFMPVALTVVSERGGTAGRGRSIGSFNSARSVGFTGARFFGGVLLGLLAPSQLYLVIAGVSFVATAAVVLLDDPTPTPETDPTLAELAGEVRTRLVPAVGDRDHLTTNGLQWLYVALVFRNVAWMGLSSLLPVYLLVEVGTSEVAMGTLLALAPAVEIGGMYIFGRAADAAGRKPLIALGLAGHAAVLLLVAGATAPASLLSRQVVAAVGMVVKGVTYSAMLTGAIAFIGDVTPVERESELMGLRSTAKGVGGVAGPALIGGLATVTSFEIAFVAGSLVVLLAAALVWTRLTESHPDAGIDAVLDRA